MKTLFKASLVATFIFMVVAGFGALLFNFNPAAEWHASQLRRASPSYDVTVAIRQKNYQFKGLYGFGISVPGIVEGRFNSLVELHGVNGIEGTTDNGPNLHLEDAAYRYATQYNAILARKILSNPDPKTQQLLKEVQAEMKKLESADPIADSLRSSRTSPPDFINANDQIPGIADFGLDMDSAFYNTSLRMLKTNTLVLKSFEQPRFNQILRRYVIPYNKNLYRLLLLRKASKTKRLKPPIDGKSKKP